MGYLLPREELNKLLNGQKLSYFPRVIPVNTPVIEMMNSSGAYWPLAHKDASLMVKLAGECIEMTGFGAINLPFDMVMEAEALGCEIVWHDEAGSTPQVKSPIFKDIKSVNFAKDILQKGRFKIVLEAIKMVRDKYQDIAILPFVEGPYTIAGLTIGINEMYKIMLKNPDEAARVIDIFSDLCILYGNKQIECGADSIIILDPNISGLGKEQFRSIILPIYRKITNELKVKSIIHICGNTNRILYDIPQSNFAAYSFDSPAMKIENVKEIIGNKMKIIGAVPTISYLLEGTQENVFNESIQCIKKGVDILAASCCIPPNVKVSNLKAMIKAIDHWNTQNKR